MNMKSVIPKQILNILDVFILDSLLYFSIFEKWTLYIIIKIHVLIVGRCSIEGILKIAMKV